MSGFASTRDSPSKPPRKPSEQNYERYGRAVGQAAGQAVEPNRRVMVEASTAQLVAASRVKADFMSKSQEQLEGASKAVTYACKSLVRQVQGIIAAKNRDEGDDVNWAELSGHEFKVQEMEQQVEILQLENKLNAARPRLGEMRKHSYAHDED